MKARECQGEVFRWVVCLSLKTGQLALPHLDANVGLENSCWQKELEGLLGTARECVSFPARRITGFLGPGRSAPTHPPPGEVGGGLRGTNLWGRGSKKLLQFRAENRGKLQLGGGPTQPNPTPPPGPPPTPPPGRQSLYLRPDLSTGKDVKKFPLHWWPVALTGTWMKKYAVPSQG